MYHLVFILHVLINETGSARGSCTICQLGFEDFLKEGVKYVNKAKVEFLRDKRKEFFFGKSSPCDFEGHMLGSNTLFYFDFSNYNKRGINTVI